MIPDGHRIGQGWRAVLAALAFGVTSLIIYGLFSSGFGRLPHTALPTPAPVPPGPVPPEPGQPAPVPPGSGQAAPAPSRSADRPAAASAGQPSLVRAASKPALWVVSDGFWFTYLPRGLERRGGRVTGPSAAATFRSPGGFVEVQVERGTVAADWDGYRERVTVLDARATTVRGRPAMAGRHPDGGRVIAWLERPGTGAWIRVSDSLGGELVAIAASVKAPVGD
ncbi:hypothetical protein [Nonomuraea gerenzanensis]|uniref:Uncharacterized protein n=1 Tax=Nonomuraea gerenzanensis TaxID=93944 RepID=A0A1M4DZK7_9ACTN|nr:hypothetical protein [Nonomuraea gerenzanensis]UBU14305.1 hypothetical protein LCN96_04555 [Nonomuraea gerenzanensis]SBO92006.1 hypothetical protein BN4615_P1520 [Nonomuraea gerenzanensis]